MSRTTARSVLVACLALSLCFASSGCGDDAFSSKDSSLRRDAEMDGGSARDLLEADGRRDAGVAKDGALADQRLADAPGKVDGPTPQQDSGPKPECLTDQDCGARKCVANICRDPCALGLFCNFAASGQQCHQGACVECLADGHCVGTRYRCNPQRFVCEEKTIDPTITKIGIFYSLWHCPVVNKPIYDISKILAGQQQWGPLGAFHYWDEPADGYYCLSQNDALLAKHAKLLRDAGIQFVFLDATNHAYVGNRSDSTRAMILEPLDRLLAVWKAIPNAPKVVPWVPILGATQNASVYTIDAILARMATAPGLFFNYQGKPLVLVTENAQYPVNAARFAALSQNFTMRRMWGVFQQNGPEWSFMQACKQSPQDPARCDQRLTVTGGGTIEQIPISVAYQATYMNLPSATPKHQGLTFRKQFETLFDNPEVPIATITGWNEWMAQRQKCGNNPTCPCSTYPQGCFIDQWDIERSRDIEPAKNAMGDYYYRLLKACIALFRSGARCDAAHAQDLCCKPYAP